MSEKIFDGAVADSTALFEEKQEYKLEVPKWNLKFKWRDTFQVPFWNLKFRGKYNYEVTICDLN